MYKEFNSLCSLSIKDRIEKINNEASNITRSLKENKKISYYIDNTIKIPEVFIGTEEVRLIIIGQDPTVVRREDRVKIKKVLNLDKEGNLKKYIRRICNLFNIDVDKNIYATNFFKNFFIDPPAKFKKYINLFELTYSTWLLLLKQELDCYPNIPIITLGENVLSTISNAGLQKRMKDYWGFPNNFPMSYLDRTQNILERLVIPFPYEKVVNTNVKSSDPEMQKKIDFYKSSFDKYCSYIYKHINI